MKQCENTITRFLSPIYFFGVGTSVSNVVADSLCFLGSFKYTDFLFVPLFACVCLQIDFPSTVYHLMKCHKYKVLWFAILLLWCLVSVLSNIPGSTDSAIIQILRLYYYFLLTFVVAYIAQNVIEPQSIMKYISLGTISVCLLTNYLILMEKGGTYIQIAETGQTILKLGSELGANPISTYCALVFPLCVVWASYSKGYIERIFWLHSAALLAWTTLIAESKMAWLSMTASLILVFFYTRTHYSKNILLVATCGILLVFCNIDYIQSIVTRELTGSYENTDQRFVMLQEALVYILSNPFSGIGLSNYVHVSPRGYEPHSAIALVSAELGIPGGVAFVFLLIACLFTNRKNASPGYLFAADMLLRPFFLSSLIISIATGLIFSQTILWVFIGLVLANTRVFHEKKNYKLMIGPTKSLRTSWIHYK